VHFSFGSYHETHAQVAYTRKQMFSYDRLSGQLRTMPEIGGGGDHCLSLERIHPPEPGGLDPLDLDGPGAYRKRLAHMLRGIKSVGFNGISILNVSLKPLLDESPWSQFTSECQQL
jgi:hypothetical protein